MDERPIKGLIRHPSVTVEAAAELMNVSVDRIREWASAGSIEIETRGDMDIVRLEDVRALAARQRSSRVRALRDRLREADAQSDDVVSVIDLQELARERGTRH